MIDKASYYFLRPDAPRDLRIFGDGPKGNEKNFVLPKDLLAFGVEDFSGIQPGLQKPSLTSSYSGAINRILFCFPSFRSNPQIAVYKSLIKHLGKEVNLVIAHNESMRSEIESWLSEIGHPLDKVEWAPLPDFVHLSHWAEDAYVALSDVVDGQNYLMEPWSFLRYGDQLIADAVSDYTDIQSKQAPLYFQGGNCLVGDDFWIMGIDYFNETKEMITDGKLPIEVPQGQKKEEAILKTFKEYVDHDRKLFLTGTIKKIPLRNYDPKKIDKEIIIDMPSKGVGNYQPIFHIDMLITLLGRNDSGDFEVMVADPKMGNKLVGYPDLPENLSETYDKMAMELANAGFVVHRNPLVHYPEMKEGSNSVGDLLKSENKIVKDLGMELIWLGATVFDVPKLRDWTHITWNNCLIENSETKGKHVYLPTFGHGDRKHLSVVDKAMEDQFKELGFEVHLLADCNVLANSMGVVHCISKYISRK